MYVDKGPVPHPVRGGYFNIEIRVFLIVKGPIS